MLAASRWLFWAGLSPLALAAGFLMLMADGRLQDAYLVYLLPLVAIYTALWNLARCCYLCDSKTAAQLKYAAVGAGVIVIAGIALQIRAAFFAPASPIGFTFHPNPEIELACCEIEGLDAARKPWLEKKSDGSFELDVWTDYGTSGQYVISSFCPWQDDGHGGQIRARLTAPNIVEVDDAQGNSAVISWQGVAPSLIRSNSVGQSSTARSFSEAAMKTAKLGGLAIMLGPLATYAFLSIAIFRATFAWAQILAVVLMGLGLPFLLLILSGARAHDPGEGILLLGIFAIGAILSGTGLLILSIRLLMDSRRIRRQAIANDVI